MLVKFGKMGGRITEYYLEDKSILEDLLEIVDVEVEDDDTIQELGINGKRSLELDSSEPLKENTTYILERIELTPQEEKICELIYDEWDSDMSTQDKKDFVKKLISCGWDK